MQYRMAWPPLTRNIKLTLGALFVLWIGTVQFTEFVFNYMLVSRDAVFERGQVWTLLSYAIVHRDFPHLLFNGLVLWMFGGEVDRRWGDKWFWGFCALCALGGGVAVVLAQLIFAASVPTIGYSGAIMGLAAAYSWYHWDRPLRLFGVIKITGKWLLVIFVAIDFLMVVGARQPISVAAHLGGMLTGLALVTGYWRPTKLKRAIKRWRARRDSSKHIRPPDGKRWN